MITAAEDPILKRRRRALDALYPEKIERVVLYGVARSRRCPRGICLPKMCETGRADHLVIGDKSQLLALPRHNYTVAHAFLDALIA
jgi:hypothetical protein